MTESKLREFIKSVLRELQEEELEEASAVGNVQGPGAGNDYEGLIREGMIQMNRHEIYEEIRLRKIIREGIKKINAKIEFTKLW